jgi:hypothetical protein
LRFGSILSFTALRRSMLDFLKFVKAQLVSISREPGT